MKRVFENVIEIPGDEDSTTIEVREHHQGGYAISRFWIDYDGDNDQVKHYGSMVRLTLEDFNLVKKAIGNLK